MALHHDPLDEGNIGVITRMLEGGNLPMDTSTSIGFPDWAAPVIGGEESPVRPNNALPSPETLWNMQQQFPMRWQNK